jgi:two-component system LytT family response regulator
MNVLIAEDEIGASRNLTAILQEVEPSCNILAVLESVEETHEWIMENPPPDLAFFDIQLSDENIFKLFIKVTVDFPVVFVTAYNQYAIRAFKVNSIDYILKPVNTKSVKYALGQFRKLKASNAFSNEKKILELLEELRGEKKKQYRKSFLIQVKDKLIPLAVAEIAYFFIENGMVYAVTSSNGKFIVNHKLDDIGKQLNPDYYFRANRQFIVSRESVAEINPYFNERLSIKVMPKPSIPIIISKAKATHFKAWMDT